MLLSKAPNIFIIRTISMVQPGVKWLDQFCNGCSRLKAFSLKEADECDMDSWVLEVESYSRFLFKELVNLEMRIMSLKG